MIPTLAQIGRRFWMPDSSSSYSGEVDWLFYFIYWVCVIAFVLIMAAMIFFVVRYRHKPGRTPGSGHSHSTVLELTWTIIPTIIVMMIFYWSFKLYINQTTPPDFAYDIQVTAYKWGWSFQYPNGATSAELHVPDDRPVRLTLASQDVIHSLFIPAFRIKKDAVPGRYNITWFQVKDPPPVREDGQRYFDLYCAEYCGTKHSLMRSRVIVHDSTQFNKWLDEAANWIATVPPAQAGLKLYQTKGCAQCHSTDGAKNTGPSFKNLFGSEHLLRSGEKVTVDENYVRESILVPSAKIVAGYDNLMPAYQGRMKDVEISAIIAWLKTISDKTPVSLEAPATPAADAKTPDTHLVTTNTPAAAPAIP